jgi:dihydropteroate synthase
MGILNITPDSFAEPSSRAAAGDAIARARQMEADGADILDIGGESTRPGSTPVDAGEELARVVPVLEELGRTLRIPISIDTYKPEVARTALSLGASIVNDVTGLQAGPALAAVAANAGAALVLMHMRGRPATMYAEAEYGDVVAEVVNELRASMAAAEAGGLSKDAIVLDPGIGFAKRAAHSYGVLARIAEIAAATERPLLVGPSRKSFMREALGDVPPPERDWGTAAAVTAAVLSGAHILRVHAVGAMRQVVRVAEEIRRAHSA